MNKRREPYISALRYSWLTRLYDPLIERFLHEVEFKRDLIEQAGLMPSQRVLDVGCGTGTLDIMIKRAHPDVGVVGLDGDEEVLAIARRKADEAGIDVRFERGMAFALPYADSSFNHIFSSLLFHHLTRQNKIRTLREAARVLRPGGGLHIADWGKPTGALMRLAFLVVQAFDGFETTADNAKGLLPRLVEQAGFDVVEERASYKTVFGSLVRYRARKPD